MISPFPLRPPHSLSHIRCDIPLPSPSQLPSPPLLRYNPPLYFEKQTERNTPFPYAQTHSYLRPVTGRRRRPEVVLAGWAYRRRDHGTIIFIDLRDRYGVTQIVITPDTPEAHEAAQRVRSEFVLAVRGTVRRRRRHGKPQPGNRRSRNRRQ